MRLPDFRAHPRWTLVLFVLFCAATGIGAAKAFSAWVFPDNVDPAYRDGYASEGTAGSHGILKGEEPNYYVPSIPLGPMKTEAERERYNIALMRRAPNKMGVYEKDPIPKNYVRDERVAGVWHPMEHPNEQPPTASLWEGGDTYVHDGEEPGFVDDRLVYNGWPPHYGGGGSYVEHHYDTIIETCPECCATIPPIDGHPPIVDVPEPATLGMVLFGFAALMAARRYPHPFDTMRNR